MYILRFNLLIDADIEDLKIQYGIEGELDAFVSNSPEMIRQKVVHISSQLEDVDNNSNFGMCINCGTWATDFTKDNSVNGMSNGAILNDSWYCDLCLPIDHPNRF